MIKYYVHITDMETRETVRKFGPYPESRAERVYEAVLGKTDMEQFDVTVDQVWEDEESSDDS